MLIVSLCTHFLFLLKSFHVYLLLSPKLPDFRRQGPRFKDPVTLKKRKFNLVIIYMGLNLDRPRHMGSETHCLCGQLTLILNIIIMKYRIYVHDVFNLGSQKL